MKAIIIAAGSGSRLAPIGITTPKILIPILNQPLLRHHIDAVRELVEEVIIIIGPNHFGQLIQHYVQNQKWPIPVRTVVQPEPLGTANAFQTAEKFFRKDERVMCLLGDDIYSPHDLKALSSHPFAILGQPVEDWQKWGILQANDANQLTGIIEKPDHFVGNIANTGAAVVTTEIFDLYADIEPSPRGEYEFTDTISLLTNNHTVNVVQVTDYWLPVGYPWHILRANQVLSEKQHRTPPIIGEKVTIGKNVTISGTVIIGDNVVIGDYVTIENSAIFENASIGAHSHIAHSIIGKHANIGPRSNCLSQNEDGATIRSTIKDQSIDTGFTNFGTVIGDNATIGQNMTINPGCKIWPNCQIESESVIEQDVIR